VRLRDLRPTDRAAVERLGVELFADYGDYADALYAWLRHPGVRTTVAVDPDGCPIGFSMVAAVEREGYLLAIGVLPDHRRRGLARALLAASIELAVRHARRWGIEHVDLDVAGDNLGAIALFGQAGFVEVERDDDRYLGGQRVVRMRRALE
jgi:[ribosomal protein S18]-alanine N-acetyltransferase